MNWMLYLGGNQLSLILLDTSNFHLLYSHRSWSCFLPSFKYMNTSMSIYQYFMIHKILSMSFEKQPIKKSFSFDMFQVVFFWQNSNEWMNANCLWAKIHDKITELFPIDKSVYKSGHEAQMTESVHYDRRVYNRYMRMWVR